MRGASVRRACAASSRSPQPRGGPANGARAARAASPAASERGDALASWARRAARVSCAARHPPVSRPTGACLTRPGCARRWMLSSSWSTRSTRSASRSPRRSWTGCCRTTRWRLCRSWCWATRSTSRTPRPRCEPASIGSRSRARLARPLQPCGRPVRAGVAAAQAQLARPFARPRRALCALGSCRFNARLC